MGSLGPITYKWRLKRGRLVAQSPIYGTCTNSGALTQLVAERGWTVGRPAGIHRGLENYLVWKAHIFFVWSIVSGEGGFLQEVYRCTGTTGCPNNSNNHRCELTAPGTAHTSVSWVREPT